MQRFQELFGAAAPLPISNIDTDQILPAQFLKTISKDGLGAALFHSLRYDDSGQERVEFVLNVGPWRKSRALIALENFGCGSSREHAPWALADFGIKCIIAPSFADIFYNNCFKSGILPIILSPQEVEYMLALTANPNSCEISVDLLQQTIELVY